MLKILSGVVDLQWTPIRVLCSYLILSYNTRRLLVQVFLFFQSVVNVWILELTANDFSSLRILLK